MARVEYEPWAPEPATLRVIAQAEAICAGLSAAGYTVTLRQLYYQFVKRALIKNEERSYKRLGTIVNRARMAGLLDWDYIVDRTRELEERPHWGTAKDTGPEAAQEFIASVLPQFRTAKWTGQPSRVEVWVEKDALVDVVARPSKRLDVPYYACRGYNSQSAAHEAATRIEGYLDEGAERVLVLHLGDHDPEGLDMTRDIEDRFATFLAGDGYDPGVLEVRRIALNMAQVRLYDPPPNPAKPTSSRYRGYLAAHGRSCWELDALDPPTIDDLITEHVQGELDDAAWADAVAREEEGQGLLEEAARRWAEVVGFLRPGA